MRIPSGMEQTKSTEGNVMDLEDFHWMRPGRAPVACQHCRAQRIRCDVTLRRGSCTNCEFYQVECQVATPKRKSKGSGPLVTIPASEVYIPPTKCAVEPTRGPTAPQSTSPLTEKPVHMSDEEFILLKNRGIFEMPSIALRHQLVQAYLRHIYSHMPVISFQDLVFMADPGRRYTNWLVFMALCSISVCYIDNERLRQLGVSSAQAASQVFFTNAKILYRFQWHGHHEYCTLQALLLLAFCEREVYGKDGWTWTWMAYTTAVQMGLDRNAAKSKRRDLGLRRRLWWTCYSQCCLLGLHKTLSQSIRLTESEILPPTKEDFEPHKPIYCLDLIPALTAAQQSSVRFIRLIDLLRIYNERATSQSNTTCSAHTAPHVLVDLKSIKAQLKMLLDRNAAWESSSIGDLATSPLDAASIHQAPNTPHGDTDMVGMFLDMERVLYNCTSLSDLEGLEDDRSDSKV